LSNTNGAVVELELGYLKLCGEEAGRWLAELNTRKCSEIRQTVRRALKIMQRGDLEQGAAMLDTADAALRTLSARFPSVPRFIRRQFLSILAYFHYRSGRLEEARGDLDEAHREVRWLAESHPFLLPAAIQCIDIYTQSARIARHENRWREVERYLGILGEIYRDQRPLCVFSTGRPVRLSDVRRFFDSLNLADRSVVGPWEPSPDLIMHLEENIFTLPDMVIPYP
jgi:hypothetical protein